MHRPNIYSTFCHIQHLGHSCSPPCQKYTGGYACCRLRTSYSLVSRRDRDFTSNKALRAKSRPAFNLGCGFTQNKAELTVLRFMTGLGGGAPLAVRLSPSSHLLTMNDSSADWRRSDLRRLEAGGTRQSVIVVPSCPGSGPCRRAACWSLDNTSIELEVDILGIDHTRCSSSGSRHLPPRRKSVRQQAPSAVSAEALMYHSISTRSARTQGRKTSKRTPAHRQDEGDSYIQDSLFRNQ